MKKEKFANNFLHDFSTDFSTSFIVILFFDTSHSWNLFIKLMNLKIDM